MKEGQREKLKPCVGVVIIKDGKVLLGKRKGSHGSGEYALPGGHLEYEESFKECTGRETLEETEIVIKNINFLCLATFCKHENRQDVLAGLSADWESGEPKIMEPNKCDGWGWYNLGDLPTPLFYPSGIIIDSYKTGKNFYDKE
jgi:8-oxo-dGTP diphosphatase